MLNETRQGHEVVLEELRLLLEALASRAENYLGGLGAGEAGRSADHEGAPRGHGTECAGGGEDGSCGWCPLCAVVANIRRRHPEMTARMTEQAGSLLALLRQALAEHCAASPPASGDESRRTPGSGPGSEHEEDGSASPKVQRITVERVSGPAPRPAASGAGIEGVGC